MDTADYLDPREMTPEDWRAIGMDPKRQPPVLKAIRSKCLDCCGGQPSEVRACPSAGCDLWPYRMGTNPFRAPPSDAQREAARAAGAAWRAQAGGQPTP